MTQTNNGQFKIWYAVSIALQLGFLIVFPIGGFILLGIVCDDYLATHPLFVILGAFVGFFITVYEIYHLLVPILWEDYD